MELKFYDPVDNSSPTPSEYDMDEHGVPIRWKKVQERLNFGSILSKSSVPHTLIIDHFSSSFRPKSAIIKQSVNIKNSAHHDEEDIAFYNSLRSRPQSSPSKRASPLHGNSFSPSNDDRGNRGNKSSGFLFQSTAQFHSMFKSKPSIAIADKVAELMKETERVKEIVDAFPELYVVAKDDYSHVNESTVEINHNNKKLHKDAMRSLSKHARSLSNLIRVPPKMPSVDGCVTLFSSTGVPTAIPISELVPPSNIISADKKRSGSLPSIGKQVNDGINSASDKIFSTSILNSNSIVTNDSSKPLRKDSVSTNIINNNSIATNDSNKPSRKDSMSSNINTTATAFKAIKQDKSITLPSIDANANKPIPLTALSVKSTVLEAVPHTLTEEAELLLSRVNTNEKLEIARKRRIQLAEEEEKKIQSDIIERERKIREKQVIETRNYLIRLWILSICAAKSFQ